MNELFRQYIESLDSSFQRLIEMEPVMVRDLPMDAPISGIYLFSDAGQHLYVGRTNSLRKRLQNHCRPSSSHNSATFAFRLAREVTGQTVATYTEQGSRSELESDPVFGSIFMAQKERVRNMDVRYVSEPVPMRQALLEMYVSVSLATPHNDFDNH